MAGGMEIMSEQQEITPMRPEGHTPDTVRDNAVSPLDFFRVKAGEAATGQTRANLLRAVDTLSGFAAGADLSYGSFGGPLLSEMVSRLLYRGYTPKTIANNVLKRLATLYNKAVGEGLAEPTDTFHSLQAALLSERTAQLTGTLDSGTFAKLRAIIAADYPSQPDMQLAKDIVLMAVYSGGMSYDEIARMRKDDYKGDDANILAIIGKYSRPKNKYLFPLDQIHSTSRQLQCRLSALILPLLTRHGLEPAPIAAHTAHALWANAAMACGIPAADIAACIGQRAADNLVTAMAAPSGIGPDGMARIRATVAATLTHNPEHWYAMHLRRHVSLADITARLVDTGITLGEIYYPMEEILRKVGHRKIFERRPVISWLVFFRARRTDLDRLYTAVGDLAWGYRLSRQPASPYAIVSDSEVRGYQQAIGTLSPATRLMPDDTAALRSGDPVEVLGGELNGRRGRLITTRTTPGGATVYRIRLDGGAHASWTVDRDPRLVRPLPTAIYPTHPRN